MFALICQFVIDDGVVVMVARVLFFILRFYLFGLGILEYLLLVVACRFVGFFGGFWGVVVLMRVCFAFGLFVEFSV